MASANDAAVALAERVSGTEEAFVDKMNKKVKELGLKIQTLKTVLVLMKKIIIQQHMTWQLLLKN